MQKINEIIENPVVKKYSKMSIMAVSVITIALCGIVSLSSMHKASASTSEAVAHVDSSAAVASDLRIAIVRMDKIQVEAVALKDLRKQRENFESKLRSSLEKEQKELEKEKKEIEKSQDILSNEALQRRVVDYQNRVNKLQRDLAERAQSIEASYQDALNTIQKKHLDPVIEAIIEKKDLSIVIDGRMARIGKKVSNLDITDDVIDALDAKVSTIKMDTPKGL
ncbi:MAG: OmpH family outer membrane protein [Alphaproteobacteria bacterium]|nr:OmpH family outer membrane protein [Alphaproteobacteria bacterium]